MENRPPQQDPPRRPPTSGRKSNGSGGSPTPPWLWLLLIGGFAIIFWNFMPKPETAVDYNPWFLDQVESDNIKKISIQANEVRGEVRQDKPYQNGVSPTSVQVHRFITYFPSAAGVRCSKDAPTMSRDRRLNLESVHLRRLCRDEAQAPGSFAGRLSSPRRPRSWDSGRPARRTRHSARHR